MPTPRHAGFAFVPLMPIVALGVIGLAFAAIGYTSGTDPAPIWPGARNAALVALPVAVTLVLRGLARRTTRAAARRRRGPGEMG
jgi:hypothetical protein